jgi:hypothetical protein
MFQVPMSSDMMTRMLGFFAPAITASNGPSGLRINLAFRLWRPFSIGIQGAALNIIIFADPVNALVGRPPARGLPLIESTTERSGITPGVWQRPLYPKERTLQEGFSPVGVRRQCAESLVVELTYGPERGGTFAKRSPSPSAIVGWARIASRSFG